MGRGAVRSFLYGRDPAPETARASPFAGLARVARRAHGLDSLGHPPVVTLAVARAGAPPEQPAFHLVSPRGLRAASPPLDRIVPPPCSDRSSTGRCHGGACSGRAGRRARIVRAVASILSATCRSRQLPSLLPLARHTSTRRRAGARPPSSLSTAAPSMTLSESRPSPCRCASTRGSSGPSRSGRSGEMLGRRAPRDRAIAHSTPARTDSRPSRGFAAARPHRPAAMRDRSSTDKCHGGACSGSAGRSARLVRAWQVDSASRWRASAIVSAVPVDCRLERPAISWTQRLRTAPTTRRSSRRARQRRVPADVAARPGLRSCTPMRSPRLRAGVIPPPASPTSRSGIRTRGTVPLPSQQRQQLR